MKTENTDRRRFLKLMTGTAVAGLAPRLWGDTQCNPYNGVCVSQVDFAEFAQHAFKQQNMPQWCWAACISMVFAFYGHEVAQARIVSEVYGAPVNMPSGYGINIARQLNRKWKDDDGAEFRATLTGAYDYDAGVNTLTNQMLVSEMDNNHPVIIGAGGHAMVLTAIQYGQTPYGPNIVGGGVFDPWPGRGARNLTPPELFPIERRGSLRFLATVRVRDL